MSQAINLIVPQPEEAAMPSLKQLLKLLDVCRYMALEKNIDKSPCKHLICMPLKSSYKYVPLKRSPIADFRQ